MEVVYVLVVALGVIAYCVWLYRMFRDNDE